MQSQLRSREWPVMAMQTSQLRAQLKTVFW